MRGISVLCTCLDRGVQQALLAPAVCSAVSASGQEAPQAARRIKPVPQRTIEFEESSSSRIIRDAESIVRAVLHTQKPVRIGAATARSAARDYLLTRSALLGLDQRELENLHLRPRGEPAEAGVEYRFLSEKQRGDMTTVTFQQTCVALPVWEAGISVHVMRRPNCFEVICVQMTRHSELAIKSLMPPQQVATRIASFDARVLAKQLGLADEDTPAKPESLRIGHQHLAVYRYEAKRRAQGLSAASNATAIDCPPARIPPVPDNIVNGSDHVVLAAYFDLGWNRCAATHWLALIDARSHSILYLEEFTADVNGKVFLADPMTTHGGPPSSASNAQLNPFRVWAALPNLRESSPQELVGSNVKIVDFELPNIPPPSKPTGADFEFDVRTNDFSAVNAYYNCDRFFGFMEDLGFRRDDYFPGTTFPIRVDHRGTPTIGGGPNSVNAQCRGKTRRQPDGSVVGEIAGLIFCLAQADAKPPIGIATDWRVVVHELGGHGTLQNHVNSSRFRFAHSAGDSLAAILSDPESKAEDKGRTFPWIDKFRRRHDRKVEDGWGWGGEKDLNDDFFQLDREQILSTTHFRLYKSLGGDDHDSPHARHFSARYTAYLILRAIETLTPITNPQHASDWLCNLIVADTGSWVADGHSGGAYEKVIHWAFEKQGLFGGTPPVDVYIDDGRGGEYQYQASHETCPAIWNRCANDRADGHETPVPDIVNFAYVRIKNRGATTARSVVVNAFQNSSLTNLDYPEGWMTMRTPRLSAPDILPEATEVTVGPFEWIPTAKDNCILMAVSANGDASNLDKFASGRSIPIWRLVPNDNNLGMRKCAGSSTRDFRRHQKYFGCLRAPD